MISKSRPLAATSVEISMFELGLLNCYNFFSLCFWIICECKVKDFIPADSIKNWTLFEALIVLVNIIIFELGGNCFK